MLAIGREVLGDAYLADRHEPPRQVVGQRDGAVERTCIEFQDGDLARLRMSDGPGRQVAPRTVRFVAATTWVSSFPAGLASGRLLAGGDAGAYHPDPISVEGMSDHQQPCCLIDTEGPEPPPRHFVAGQGVQHCCRVLRGSPQFRALGGLGIVHEISGKRRDRLFSYDEYLRLLNVGTEPLAKS